MLVEASVEPQEAAKAGYTWSSSDETVATVDALGRITALKAGKVNIIATANDGSGATGTCEITVVDKGDMDSNGELDINDANKLINNILGKE